MATAQIQEGESGNFIQRASSWPVQVKNYFEELQMEMRRVTWPSWKQVRATTLVVIVAVFAFAAYFAVVDQSGSEHDHQALQRTFPLVKKMAERKNGRGRYHSNRRSRGRAAGPKRRRAPVGSCRLQPHGCRRRAEDSPGPGRQQELVHHPHLLRI